MEEKQAIAALAALAQEHRLAVFRLLVKKGPQGASAGDVADRLTIPPSTLSHHLAHLQRTGLLRSWRVQRNIFYAVDFEGSRRLIAFLTEECCQGHPQLCGYEKAAARGDGGRSREEPEIFDEHSADDSHQRPQSVAVGRGQAASAVALSGQPDHMSQSGRIKGGSNG